MKKLVPLTLLFATLALTALADDDDDPPPPEVIATLTPVYVDGHAAYWWHDRWHYMDEHQHWNRYHTEPAQLHDWRNTHQREWHYYAGGRGGGARGGEHRR